VLRGQEFFVFFAAFVACFFVPFVADFFVFFVPFAADFFVFFVPFVADFFVFFVPFVACFFVPFVACFFVPFVAQKRYAVSLEVTTSEPSGPKARPTSARPETMSSGAASNPEKR
jgi:hypothetical protein